MSKQNQLPEIDYLAKDYASFRQIILDHLTSRLSTWMETSEADIGNVIIEILAYSADYLSYYQDAIATEAYLSTARRRPSIKHHVRLLDYILHEGCNARTWIVLEVSHDTLLPQGTPILARIGELTNIPVISPGSPAYNDALEQQPTIFETMYDYTLFNAYNTLEFFVEPDQDAKLPTGCTSAILLMPARALQVGQVLLFEEVKGIETGDQLDADPTHRAIVRLTSVQEEQRGKTSVVAISWDVEDALSFDLVLATHLDDDYITALSLIHGNVLLADHGRTIYYEQLAEVSAGRYHPRLMLSNLTHTVSSTENALTPGISAMQALTQNPLEALPALRLFKKDSIGSITIDTSASISLSKNSLSTPLRNLLYTNMGIVLSDNVTIVAIYDFGWEIRDPARKQSLLLTGTNDHSMTVSILKQWNLRRDLISSVPLTNAYCVDMEEDGHAYLRFCPADLGEPPVAGSTFLATYRVGRGNIGNISANTLAHVVINDNSITAVCNPLPAQGGINQQALEQARLQAPVNFQTQQRCIITSDYVEILCRHQLVVNAAAQLRWTGSWSTMFLYIQPTPGQEIDNALKATLTRYLENFRATGYEVEIRPPYYVMLQIIMRILLKPDAYANTIYDTLQQTFSNEINGFFYPGNFTFGQTVYRSQLIAQAMAVRGVIGATIERFERTNGSPTRNAPDGQPTIGPFEIVRLDNDHDRPYNGQIQFLIERGL